MNKKTVETLLKELGEKTAEPVRSDLAEEIKEHIPHSLTPHKAGMGTVNIMIDLRINRLTAAAIIIATMILLVGLFSHQNSGSVGIYQDSKLLVKYLLGGTGVTRTQALERVKQFYEFLVDQGKEVAYYGDSLAAADSGAVLLQWKIAPDKYRVILGDLQVRTVSAEELIKLQAEMIQNQSRQ